jgi:hypothetical protein
MNSVGAETSAWVWKKKISIALRAGKGLGINIEIILGIDQARIENGNNSS